MRSATLPEDSDTIVAAILTAAWVQRGGNLGSQISEQKGRLIEEYFDMLARLRNRVAP
jgi:hypothetical protein